MTTGDSQRSALAEYLAAHDIRCHHCRYNLRGCTEPVCPECGTVIARPVGRERRQALRCLCCGCELGLAPLERCPECGSDEILLGVRETPIRPHPLGFLGFRLPDFRSWKGVPRVLWATGALSAAAGVTFIARYFGAIVGALSMPLLLLEPLAAALGIFAPALGVLAWYVLRRTLNSYPPPARRRLTLAVTVSTATISLMSYLSWP
ncbi:MAG TPA: hypothetical protein VFF69_00125 [Phycisphaerales bacterium]|nr:hypothetical protein [Phycisphaerales bacterium]